MRPQTSLRLRLDVKYKVGRETNTRCMHPRTGAAWESIVKSPR